MMLHTTIRPLLVATLFCLPFSMSLHADEVDLPNLFVHELGTSNEACERLEEQVLKTQNETIFTSEPADDNGADIENEGDNDNIEGAAKTEELGSPNDESKIGQTPSGDDDQSSPAQQDKTSASWLQNSAALSFFKESYPVLLEKLSESVWFQLQTVGAAMIIPFMAYKTSVHIKKIFTDKEKQRGKHLLRAFLYGTSGVITIKALLQYVHSLKNDVAQI